MAVWIEVKFAYISSVIEDNSNALPSFIVGVGGCAIVELLEFCLFHAIEFAQSFNFDIEYTINNLLLGQMKSSESTYCTE